MIDAKTLRHAIRGPQGRACVERLARSLGVPTGGSDAALVGKVVARLEAMAARDELLRRRELESA